MGACSRWALIRSWALIRINTVVKGQLTFKGQSPFSELEISYFIVFKNRTLYLNLVLISSPEKVKNSSPKKLLADCQRTVGQQLADCPPTVGWLLANCWPTVVYHLLRKSSANSRPTVGRLSANCPTVGSMSVICWPRVGQNDPIDCVCMLSWQSWPDPRNLIHASRKLSLPFDPSHNGMCGQVVNTSNSESESPEVQASPFVLFP